MRFLADECCLNPLIELLRIAGHDVRLAVVTHAAADDLHIAKLAAEDDRILLTEDYDFGEIAVRLGVRVPGVLIVGLGKADPMERSRKAAALVAELDSHLLGHLTIMDGAKPRRPKL